MAETKATTKKTKSGTSQKKDNVVKKTQPKKTTSASTKKNTTTTSAAKKNSSKTAKASSSKTTKKPSTSASKSSTSTSKKSTPQKKTSTQTTTKTKSTPSTTAKKKVSSSNTKAKGTTSTKTKTNTSAKKKETIAKSKQEPVKKKEATSKTKQKPIKKITSKEKVIGKEVKKKTKDLFLAKVKDYGHAIAKNIKKGGNKLKQKSTILLEKANIGAKKVGNSLKKVGSRFLIKTKETSKKVAIKISASLKKLGSSIKENRKKKKEKTKKSKPVLKKKEVLKNGNKREEILLDESKKGKRKGLKFFIVLVVLCIVIEILLLLPYGIGTYYSTDSNKVLDVPKFVMLKEECCNYSATFTTPRRVWALEKELEEIISSYEVLNCDGKQYYYNIEQNYTITDYGIHKGTFFNEIYFTYGSGNSCDIDTKFKKLELLADDFSINDAKKDGNYVMEGDQVYNKEAYDDFMKNVKNKIPSTLRIVTTNKEGDVLITDLEYLSSGKYMVSYDGTRDRNAKNHSSIIAYKFEHLKVSKNKLYAYNGSEFVIKNAKKYETYYLLTLPSE